MAYIRINDIDTYYELAGEGPPLVLIHGAFGDACIWEPQWRYFQLHYKVLRYDLRGHGRTGSSNLGLYSMTTFVNDLHSLLDELQVQSPVICGLSWGGSVAQLFASQAPHRLSALVLASSAVAIDFTLLDRLLCKVVFPWWAMRLAIKTMRVERFTRFTLWLSRFTMGSQWLQRNRDFNEYLKHCMLNIEGSEYLKIWAALYKFREAPLSKIACPTLVLNGEYESKNAYRHAQEILRCVPNCETGVIPAASHAMNLEEPGHFNELVEKFLQRSLEHHRAC